MSERNSRKQRLRFDLLESRETPAPVAGVHSLSAVVLASVVNDASIPTGTLIKGRQEVNYGPAVKLAAGTGVSLTGNATGSAAGLGSFTGKVVNSIAFDFRSFSLKETIQAPNSKNEIFASIVGHYKHRTNTVSAKGGATTEAFFIYGGTGEFAGLKARGSASLSPIRLGTYPFRAATIAFRAKVIS